MPQVGGFIAVGLMKAGVGLYAASAIGTALGSLLVSTAMTVLSQALMGQPKQEKTGIKTDVTTAGENTPQSIILGTYATAGNMVAPPMTSGSAGGAPNGFLTYVIDVSDIPVSGLAALWINDEKVPLGPPDPAGAMYPNHRPVTSGKYAGHAWVRFYDGTQTTASESLTTISGQDRPWATDMIGRGVGYAIVRFRFNQEVYSGLPGVLFEVDGIRLYDPRQDSTAGGSGAQRWASRGTWTHTRNPAVMIYNILRGITLPDGPNQASPYVGGTRWGGEATAADLPTANWFAAMNECDLTVGGQPQYRAGYEVRIGPESMGGMEPAGVIESLLRVCSGQISEFGGTWRMRAGPVGMPVAVFTDDDIIITEGQQFEPFPGLSETYNGVHAQYPEPEERWTSKEAPPRYTAAFEAQDDNRRLVASLNFDACPYPVQVQRLMLAYAKDGRRARYHDLTLPPDLSQVDVLDAVAWSSARNGYINKVGEITSTSSASRSLLHRIGWRERDPADYDWTPDFELPTSFNPVTQYPIAPQAVPGWTVSATTIKDGSGTDRRPAIVLGWSTEVEDAVGIAYEIRVVGRSELAASGSTQNFVAGGLIVAEGVLKATQMQARGKLIARDRQTNWTSWTTVTTPDVGFTDSDFAGGIKKLFSDQGLYAIEYFASLPTTGNFVGRLVFNTTDGKLYRWTGSAWEPAVSAALDRLLDETDFATGISIPRVYATLPTTGNYNGRLAVLSGNGKLYRYSGGAWSAAVPAVDVTGQLTNTQIADIAAAKLTGQITGTQITNGAISTSKIEAGAVSTASLAAGAVVADKIASNAITSAKIEAGAIETAKLAAGAITTGKLDANAVTAAKIAAGAVGADQIAANAIVASKIAVTDFTNLVPDDQIQDPASWGIVAPAGNVVHVPNSGNPSAQSLGVWQVNAGGANATFVSSKLSPAVAGGSYFYSARTYSENAGATLYSAMQFLDAAMNETGRVGMTASSTGWTTHTGTATAPAGTYWVRIYYSFPVSGYAAGLHYLGGPVIRRRLTGELVVDGTITGDKILANTITGGLLATAGIITTAAQITNALIDTAHIKNLAVETIKIKDGAVSNFSVGGSTSQTVNNSTSFLLSNTTVSVGQYDCRILLSYEAGLADEASTYLGASLVVRINGTIVAQTGFNRMAGRYFGSVVGRPNISPDASGDFVVTLRVEGCNTGKVIDYTNLTIATWRR